MATPPFLPDETKPADGDVVSQYPAVERAFRDIMESWLLIDHDTAGEHVQVTLPELGADPTNVTDTGFVYTKDDGGDTELFYIDDAGNVVQLTVDGEVNSPVSTLDVAGITMLFHQDAAPTGWTKDVAGTLDDHALRIVTSTAWASGSQGTSPFSTVFGLTATDGHTLTAAQSGLPSHNHTIPAGFNELTGSRFQESSNNTGTTNTGSKGGTSASSSHSHNMELRVKYANFILAVKD